MSVVMQVRDPLFTKKYRRCRVPVDNAFAPGDRVMVAVPGGVVFVSRRGVVYPGKRTIMFCDYTTSPAMAEDLFGHQLHFKDVISLAFTGEMLITVAEGSLDHAGIEGNDDEKGVWCLSWTDLCERRAVPIRLFSVPRRSVGWGSVAGGYGNFAFLCDGTLTTLNTLHNVQGQQRLRTKVVFGDDAIISISENWPEVIAIAGGKRLAVCRFDSPAQLHNNTAPLPMPPSCLEISRNGQMVALGYPSGLLEIRDSRDFRKPIFSLTELSRGCTSLVFSGISSDRLFAAAGDSGEIVVVDTRHFSGHKKLWLPAIPRPSETLSRYNLRSALWPDFTDLYDLPTSKPESFIANLAVSDLAWLDTDTGVLAVGTNEGILFIRCGRRTFIKSAELM